VQVVPAELLLRPGEKQQFTVRLYNSRGQFLKESPATFSVQGAGEINDSGEFSVPTGLPPTASIVTAKVGDLAGRARIRIVRRCRGSLTLKGSLTPRSLGRHPLSPRRPPDGRRHRAGQDHHDSQGDKKAAGRSAPAT
jgi:hypothetical protein